MDPPVIKRLLSVAPLENQIAFFRRQINFLLGNKPDSDKARSERIPTQFLVDNTAVIAKVSSSLTGYSRAARTLGYSEDAISQILKDFWGTTNLLPFDEFLDRLSEYEPPHPVARTLSHDDFVGADATFPRGGEDRVFRPSGLQAKVIDHVFSEAARLGTDQIRGVIVMATGLGKSFLSAFLIDRQITQAGGYAQFIKDPHQCVLFVVNSVFIRNQTCEKYRRYFSPLLAKEDPLTERGTDGRFLNIDTGSRDGLLSLRSQDASRVKFIFCLFQSIHLLPERLRARVSHVIVDEAHHVAAPSYMSIVKRLAEARNTRLMVGLTATLYHRADANASRIRGVFGGSVFADLPWTVAKELGLFPSLRYLEYQWDLGPSGVFRAARRSRGISRYSVLKDALASGALTMQHFCFQLSRSARDLPRAGLDDSEPGQASVGQPSSEPSAAMNDFLSILARETAEFLSSFDLADPCRPKRVMAFLSSVRQIEAFVRAFRQYEEQAHAKVYSAHYKIHPKALSALFSEFSACPRLLGKTLILCTVSMATEGFDLPYVDCVAFMRRTESERVYVQQLGRCLRLHASKRLSYVLDFVYALRLRWLRLREELLDSTLLSYIKCFWDVEVLQEVASTVHGGIPVAAGETVKAVKGEAQRESVGDIRDIGADADDAADAGNVEENADNMDGNPQAASRTSESESLTLLSDLTGCSFSSWASDRDAGVSSAAISIASNDSGTSGPLDPLEPPDVLNPMKSRDQPETISLASG